MRYEHPVRVVVIGVGSMGTLHCEKLLRMPDVRLIGVWDKDEARRVSVARRFGVKAFASLDEAIGYAQAVVLATPTNTHGRLGVQVLQRARHLFVEKPLAATSDEAEILVDLAAEHGVVLMVGHIENFNPAFAKAREFIDSPLFIEAHRLTRFRGRGDDVSVVHDLMIHDIELVAGMVGCQVDFIHASGAAVLTDKVDIANVRIQFNCGCVANFTASRLSLSPKRKMRIFQQSCYISVDFSGRVLEVARPAGKNPEGEVIEMDGFKIELLRPKLPEGDPLEAELRFFIDCVKSDTPPPVESALAAVRICEQISEALEAQRG